MMKNKILDTEIVVKTHRVIEAQEIPGTDFVYYEDIKEINKNGEEYTEKNTGFTSKENILAVSELNPISWKIKAPKMYDNIATIAAIRKSNFNSVLEGKKHITEVIEPANEISYPVTEDYMLVLWNGASHKIANLNYDFIPIPISFGYIDGSIDNEIYNLDKLLDILKNDEHVVNREDLTISDIPYYNCDEYKTKSIEFLYLLPQDIYEKTCSMDSFLIHKYILENVISADICKLNKE